MSDLVNVNNLITIALFQRTSMYEFYDKYEQKRNEEI